MKKKHTTGPRFDGIYVTKEPHLRSWQALLFHADGSLLAARCEATQYGQIEWPRRMGDLFAESARQGNWSLDSGLVHHQIRYPAGYASAVGEVDGDWLDSSWFSHITGQETFTRSQFVPIKGNLKKHFNTLRAPSDEAVAPQKPHLEGTPVWPPPFPLLAHGKRNQSVKLAVDFGEGEFRTVRIPPDEWITIAQGYLWDMSGAGYLYEGTRSKTNWRFNGEHQGSLRVTYHSARDGEGDGYEGDIIHALPDESS